MDHYMLFNSPNLWQTLLDDMGANPIMLRDKRYDAVFHMVSTAVDLEEVFTQNLKDKKADFSIEKAKENEKRLQDAWLGHPNR